VFSFLLTEADSDDSAQSGDGSDGIPNVGVEEDQLEIEMTLGENKYVNTAAIIFDGMAVLQSMKKTSSVTKIFHINLAFVKRIKTLMKGYTQGRVIFDRYLDVSLKDKTRAKRAASSVTMEFKVHDDMSIAKVSLKGLFSNSSTKSQLTEILAEALRTMTKSNLIGPRFCQKK